MVVDYSNQIRNSQITEIADKKNNDRFPLSFDEWTSRRNHRYLSINLHVQNCQFWSLDLVRITGSMPADKCVENLERKLAEYGLCLRKDIVGIMAD